MRTTTRRKVFWLVAQAVQAVALSVVLATSDNVQTLKVRVYRTVLQSPDGPRLWESTSAAVDDVSLHWMYVLVPWCTVAHYLAIVASNNFDWKRPILLDQFGYRASRWVEYAISASLMSVVVGIMSSVTDVNALMGLVASNVGTQFCGWIADRADMDIRDRWIAFGVGCVVWLSAWAPLLVNFLAATTDVPDFVRVVVWGITLAYSTFPTILVLRLVRVLDNGDPSLWRTSDHWFDVASFVSKALLDWTIVMGLVNW